MYNKNYYYVNRLNKFMEELKIFIKNELLVLKQFTIEFILDYLKRLLIKI